MADRTAAALHGKLVKALDLLDDAEVRFAAAQDRAKAKLRRQHPRMDEHHVDKLGPIAARGEDDMANAMADWSLAHQRVQSYAAALTAVCAYAEQINHRRARRTAVVDDDLRDCKPIVGESVAAGFAINTGDKRRWPDA